MILVVIEKYKEGLFLLCLFSILVGDWEIAKLD